MISQQINQNKAGLGIRAELFEPVLNEKPELSFLEAHSENYFGDSIARAKLLDLREDYPVSLHGVGLSLGRADDLDSDHLSKLRRLVDDVEPALVSEHLAWSAYSHAHLPDLLPLPLTEQALFIICRHIDEMQEALGRQILLENPSNYLLFDQLQIPEPEFLNTLAERTGCGLLVDVNNVVVSANNLKRNPQEYIEQLNSQFIGQYHLAGYTPVDKNGENILIDTHNQTVYPEVWQLFESTIQQHGSRPTLFEWDSDFPEFSVLLAECEKATAILSKTQTATSELTASANIESQHPSETKPVELEPLQQLQDNFLTDILSNSATTQHAIDSHQSRIWIYQNNVYAATIDYLEAVFPAVSGVVGHDYFKQIARLFIRKNPPQQGNIHQYGAEFAKVVRKRNELKNTPYLSDLIAYEWALHSAYYAEHDDIIDVSSTPQEELLTTTIAFNASVTLLRSMFPLYEIHRQSLPDYSGEVVIDLNDSQDSLLIYKQDYQVKTKVLDENEINFLQMINNSDNLLQAIESISGSIEPETISAMLGFVFENNLLKKINTNNRTNNKEEC